MADWTYTPDYSYKMKRLGEKLLVNILEDFSEIRAEKGLTKGGIYTETYRASAVELTAMLAFFGARRLVTPFTKLTYDPDDAGWDPDDPASATGPEATVRFASWPSWNNTTIDDYAITFSFRRLPNE